MLKIKIISSLIKTKLITQRIIKIQLIGMILSTVMIMKTSYFTLLSTTTFLNLAIQAKQFLNKLGSSKVLDMISQETQELKLKI